MVSGKLAEKAKIVVVEDVDIVDAVFEHGDTRRLQPWCGILFWRDGTALASAAHEFSEFLHRLLKPPQPFGRTKPPTESGLSATVYLEVPVQVPCRL
ncbi:hypothetical protein MELA_00618 [Candidatus Methylomirabilis lanthanidiphila]|uniref:Uncharacterized protein n=1 Tax=Candidatus Methylomirabilis lanthanidiphila TaxID=2211376 RepID=A0A564ZI81_9BACT|nr:hypothetical protein MELA_00618 [Candidatus Methylomirabilis lanthanidiphila]